MSVSGMGGAGGGFFNMAFEMITPTQPPRILVIATVHN